MNNLNSERVPHLKFKLRADEGYPSQPMHSRIFAEPNSAGRTSWGRVRGAQICHEIAQLVGLYWFYDMHIEARLARIALIYRGAVAGKRYDVGAREA